MRERESQRLCGFITFTTACFALTDPDVVIDDDKHWDELMFSPPLLSIQSFSCLLAGCDRTRRKSCKCVIARVLFIFIRILSGWCGVGRMSLTAVIGRQRERGLLGNSSENNLRQLRAKADVWLAEQTCLRAHTHTRCQMCDHKRDTYTQGHVCFHSCTKLIISHNNEICNKRAEKLCVDESCAASWKIRKLNVNLEHIQYVQCIY